MSHGRICKNAFAPHIKSSCGIQNKTFNPMTVGLGIDFFGGAVSHDRSLHIKSSSGTQNEISSPMCIGLGIDYVA